MSTRGSHTSPAPRPMVDLHAHILPGIDDGPASMDESVELARAVAADGVGTIVATPHLREDHPGVVPEELAGRCDELRTALSRRGIPLTLVPGGEVDLLWAGTASDSGLRLASFGQLGRHLLVETPYTPLPRHFEQLLFELELRGFGLVLAHPERNPTLQKDLRRIEALVDRGVMLQVTASSLVHGSGSIRETTRVLVRRRLVHVIASDIHGIHGPRRGLLSAGEVAAGRLSPERASWMVREGPAAVLAGERPSPPAVPDGGRGGLLRPFRRR